MNWLNEAVVKLDVLIEEWKIASAQADRREAEAREAASDAQRKLDKLIEARTYLLAAFDDQPQEELPL